MLFIFFIYSLVIGAVLSAFDESDIAFLEQRFQSLSELIKKNNAERHHEYIPELAGVLENATTALTCGIQNVTSFTTEHSVLYKDHVFTIGVKHSQCYANLTAYSLHDFDVIFRAGCPISQNVINVTSYVALRTGDEASTLGYVNNVSRFWHGRLSGRFHQTQVLSNVNVNSDEYLFSGVSQMNGMSGGAALNGVGYTGMVHAVYSPGSAHLALVIPAATIFQGFDAMEPAIKAKYFSKLSDCSGVAVLTIPSLCN